MNVLGWLSLIAKTYDVSARHWVPYAYMHIATRHMYIYGRCMNYINWPGCRYHSLPFTGFGTQPFLHGLFVLTAHAHALGWATLGKLRLLLARVLSTTHAV